MSAVTSSIDPKQRVSSPVFHLIGTFAGNPQVAGRVSKQWRDLIVSESTHNWYSGLIKTYQREPFLELYVMRAETYATLDSGDPAQPTSAAKRVQQIFTLLIQDADCLHDPGVLPNWQQENAGDQLSAHALRKLFNAEQVGHVANSLDRFYWAVYRNIEFCGHEAQEKRDGFHNRLKSFGDDQLGKVKAIHLWLRQERAWIDGLRDRQTGSKKADFWIDRAALRLIPSELQLFDVKDLTLIQNKIRKIPDWIVRLPNLWNLRLDDNELTELSEAACRLPNLGYLNLEGNNISALPDCFVRLTRLFGLNILRNPLRAFPDNFAECRLSSLYCSEGLSTLPVIQRLPNLKQINSRLVADYNPATHLLEKKKVPQVEVHAPPALPAPAPQPQSSSICHWVASCLWSLVDEV